MEIVEENAEMAWKKVLKLVFEKGKDFQDKDNRTCREMMGITISIKNPSSSAKPIEIINSFKRWVYPSIEELEEITLSKKEIPGYYYNYGERAFNFDGINQIDDYVIPLLKKDRTSRRATVIFYNPKKDSQVFRKDIPSKLSMGFLIRNDKLHVSSMIRSNDLFFGWPANIYQESVLQEYVAKALGCKCGSINIISLSAHIFEEQFDHIKKIINGI